MEELCFFLNNLLLNAKLKNYNETKTTKNLKNNKAKSAQKPYQKNNIPIAT